MKIHTTTLSAFLILLAKNVCVHGGTLRNVHQTSQKLHDERNLVGDDDYLDQDEWDEMYNEGGGAQEFDDEKEEMAEEEEGERKLVGDDDYLDQDEWDEMYNEGGGAQEFDDEKEEMAEEEGEEN